MSLELIVYGTPAPQGSKKHVGRGIIVESSAKVAPWRESIKAAVLAERLAWGAKAPMEGPLRVVLMFTLPKPASAPKRKRIWPSKRPDLDKLIRSTLDGLGESGVWRDDAQVVYLTAAKAYPKEGFYALDIPGAKVWVSPIDVNSIEWVAA